MKYSTGVPAPPAAQQGARIDSMSAWYDELVAENTLLQSIVVCGLEWADLPLPTTQQIASMNILETEYREAMVESSILKRLIIDLMANGDNGTCGGMDMLLCENSKMTRDVHSRLGPRAQSFAPLIEEAHQNANHARAAKVQENQLIADMNECLIGLRDYDLDATLRKGLHNYTAHAAGGLPNAPMQRAAPGRTAREVHKDRSLEVVDDILLYLDKMENSNCLDLGMLPFPEIIREFMAEEEPLCAGSAHETVSGLATAAAPAEDFFDEDAALAEDSFDEDSEDQGARAPLDYTLELAAQIAANRTYRPRRRHNVNGSTRAKRRRQRAREEAAKTTAAETAI